MDSPRSASCRRNLYGPGDDFDLAACHTEFVTAEAAGEVRVFPVDRTSIDEVGVNVAAKFAS